MNTYRLSGPALLRLAAIAAEAPGADADEILGIVRDAVIDAPEPEMPHIEAGPDLMADGADKLAKAE